MAFKTSKMDHISSGFLPGFLHQKPILKKRLPEQKSRCRTCAEACHSPFNIPLWEKWDEGQAAIPMQPEAKPMSPQPSWEEVPMWPTFDFDKVGNDCIASVCQSIVNMSCLIVVFVYTPPQRSPGR